MISTQLDYLLVDQVPVHYQQEPIDASTKLPFDDAITTDDATTVPVVVTELDWASFDATTQGHQARWLPRLDYILAADVVRSA